MEKILSVSIAAYNTADTLRECLDPFLKTKMLDRLDIMIIDDGSKDKTAQTAREYEKKYPEAFRLIRKENGGWGSTVNTGIREAEGLYFKQLDGDDYYEPQALDALVDYLQTEPSDLVIAPYVTYSAQSGEVIAHKDCNPGCAVKTVYRLKDISGFSPFMHSLSVKTGLLRRGRAAVTEHCFYTDTEFVLKACNQADTVSFFDRPVYFYRRAAAGQSMSLDGLEKHYRDQQKVIEVLIDYMHRFVRREEVRKIYDELLFGTCYWQYLVLFYITPSREHKKSLAAFDRMLKEKAPDYYAKIAFGELRILRKTKFAGYSILARHKKKKDRRFTPDGRLAD